VALLVYVLACFLALTAASLIAIEIFERIGGNGSGYQSFKQANSQEVALESSTNDPSDQEVGDRCDSQKDKEDFGHNDEPSDTATALNNPRMTDTKSKTSEEIDDSHKKQLKIASVGSSRSLKMDEESLSKHSDEQSEIADHTERKRRLKRPNLKRMATNPRTPRLIRTFTKGLLVTWGFFGILASGILIANFLLYVHDNNALQSDLVSIVNESSGDEGIALFESDGNISSTGWQITSEYFLIPGPLVEEVASKFFVEASQNESFVLYDIDWIEDRCSDHTCLSLSELLPDDGNVPEEAYEIIFVAGPQGTNPKLMLLLVIALALDALTFSAFAILVCVRWRTISVDQHRKRAMLFESMLVTISIALLGVLVWLALAFPVQYTSIGFLSQVGDRTSVVPLLPKDDTLFTIPYEYDYVVEVETEDSVLWCPALAVRLVLSSQYDLSFTNGTLSDWVEGFILTGELTDAVYGCKYVGGVRHRSLVSNASYWDEVIDFVQDQVVNQGVLVDGLLIAMDILVLIATYLFIIL